ncbi:MAG TPA: HAMP domain-containing sensor histidine kinase [Gaiellaceae bacterium]|jgi:signal transduction histidine kinase|nr:HAMP domain-containing sensor histidine kinase [Gaiellaceae bacterium]
MRVSRDFRLGAGILGVELVLSGVYFLFPSSVVTQDTIYEIFGGGAVAAILWSIWRWRPEPRLPWLGFALGNTLFVAGDIAFDISPNATQPAIADYLYLIAYPIFAALPVMLIVRSGSHRRVGALTDAAIVTLAFVVFEWVFVMEPNLHSGGPLGPRLVAGVLYPVMDIVLIGAFAGFFVSPAWRTPAFAFLVLGALTQLLGDTAHRINGGAYSGGAWGNWPWMASYIFWTAAVLHPSMRRLGQRNEEPETRVVRWRLVALAGALLTVPVARVIADVEHKRVGIWVVGALQAAIALLVIIRMGVILDAVDKIRGRLAQKNEELVQADLLKDEFIALVSHDLRTPLTSIIGYVELALDDEGAPLDEERRRYIEVVARSSDRLLRLVDDLLLAARLQSGRFMLNIDETDLESIAAETLDDIHARAQLKGVSLVLAADGPIRVECDRRRVLQLLDNLVSNAVKFTPEGGRVDVRVERTLTGAAVEVCDTGVGIGAGEEERIFERFYRSATAVSDQVPGTGLGLFIARAIAERHGGKLVARRRDGGGTMLRLELPERATATSAEPELVA